MIFDKVKIEVRIRTQNMSTGSEQTKICGSVSMVQFTDRVKIWAGHEQDIFIWHQIQRIHTSQKLWLLKYRTRGDNLKGWFTDQYNFSRSDEKNRFPLFTWSIHPWRTQSREQGTAEVQHQKLHYGIQVIDTVSVHSIFDRYWYDTDIL
jgi:hypothetical protein